MNRRYSRQYVRQVVGCAGEPCGSMMESLESRQLLAAVSWDGGAGTNSWHDAANWNRGGVDAVPQNGDDVTISVAGNPTITFSTGTLTLASLVTDEALTITNGTLGLQPGGTASINAALTLNGNGATLTGGTWNVAGGSLRATSSGGQLADATINGDITLDTTSASVRLSGATRFAAVRLLANNATLQTAPGYVLHDLVVVDGAATGARSITGAVGGIGTLTISPTGVIRVAAGSTADLGIFDSNALTLVNNGLISLEAPGRTLSFNNTALTNNATIQAPVGTLNLAPSNFTNAATGTVIAQSGTTLNISGMWSSAGTININSATVNFGGTFTSVGTIVRTGGTVNLTGTFSNPGTFTFNAASGSWNLRGGSVSGGTIAFTAGERLLTTLQGGVLNNVQVTGDLLLDTTSASVRAAGTTRFTAARLTGNSTRLEFAPGYVLQDLVVAEGATAGNRTIQGAVGGIGTLTIAPSGVIRLAAGAGGGLTISDSNALTLINNGLVTAEAAGRSLSFGNTTVTNNAVMQVILGTLDVSPTNMTTTATGTLSAQSGGTLTIGGNWSNAGMITVNAATVNLGGTFATTGTFNRTGGTVNLTGTFNNPGVFTLNAATGSWNLSGGTISGGSLVFAAGERLRPTSAGGVLSNVQITGELVVDSTSASVRVSGTTRFTAVRLAANAASLDAAPGYVLQDLVVVEGAATGNRTIRGAVGGTGTLTIAPSGVIRLAAGSGGGVNINDSNVMTLINNGLISAEATGRALTVNNTTVTNNATIQVTAGTLDISPTNFTNQSIGTVSAQPGSILTISGNWSNTGTITVNGAVLNLGGSFTLAAAGTLNRTGGTVNLTGTLDNTGATFTFTPAVGPWNVLGGTITGGSVVFNGLNRLIPTASGGLLSNVQITGDIVVDTTSASIRASGTTRFTAARLTANAASIDFAPGYVLQDLVVAEGAATGNRNIRGAVGGTGTLTIAPSGVIRVAAGSGGGLTINNSNVMTLINNGIISAEATGRTLFFSNSTVTNNATIQAIAGTLDIVPTNFTNAAAGALSAQPGTTITIGGNWSNADGTITINTATLNLGGTFTLSSAGTINRTAGTVNLTGTLTNTGNIFTFTPAVGPWNLLGGTVNGGAVVFNGANRLIPTTSSGGLNDVQVTGEIIVDTTSASIRASGTTRFTAARLTANAASIDFAPGYVLQDLVVVEGAATGNRNIRGAVGGTGTLTIAPSGVIRIAAGSGGGLTINNSNVLTLINNGLITAEATGRTLFFSNSTVTNNATLQAIAGTLDISPTNFTNAATGTVLAQSGSVVNISGMWSSPGTINMTSATVTLGGTFSATGFTLVRSGGTVNLTGMMNNAGNTFTFSPATGSWNLLGGSVTGGAIVMDATNRFVFTSNAGNLTDVQITGDLLMDATSVSVRVIGSTRFGTARLTANAAAIDFAPGYTLHDSVIVEGAATGSRSIRGASGGNGTLTIAPTGVIRVAPGSGGGLTINDSNFVTLTNNGTIANEAAGRTISISVSTVTNVNNAQLTGGTWIAAGTASITLPSSPIITTNNASVTVGGPSSFPALATLSTNNGTFTTAGGGTYTITPSGGTLQNNGTMTLGPGNVLAVAGDFTMAPAAAMIVQVRETMPGDIGRLSVTGVATLTGSLTVTPVDGWQPECINAVFITAGTLIGQFATQSLPTAPLPFTSFVVYLGEVRFAISPPSDFNRDGFLNSQDFFDFLNGFFALDPAADFNNDGFINSQDFFDFITDFFAGC